MQPPVSFQLGYVSLLQSTLRVSISSNLLCPTYHYACHVGFRCHCRHCAHHWAAGGLPSVPREPALCAIGAAWCARPDGHPAQWLAEGREDLPRWLEVVKADVLSVDTPVELRRLVAGEEHYRQQMVARVRVSEFLRHLINWKPAGARVWKS